MKKEELLDRFKGWVVDCRASYIIHKYEWTRKDEQACKEIEMKILNNPTLKEA